MLEIILLIFLTKDIGKIAIAKGLKPFNWKIYLILGWIFSELVGFVIGAMIFGSKNLFSIVLVGIAFALGSFYSLRAFLQKFPDATEDEIDNIGKN